MEQWRSEYNRVYPHSASNSRALTLEAKMLDLDVFFLDAIEKGLIWSNIKRVQINFSNWKKVQIMVSGVRLVIPIDREGKVI
jgi:hypothetical protein